MTPADHPFLPYNHDNARRFPRRLDIQFLPPAEKLEPCTLDELSILKRKCKNRAEFHAPSTRTNAYCEDLFALSLDSPRTGFARCSFNVADQIHQYTTVQQQHEQHDQEQQQVSTHLPSCPSRPVLPSGWTPSNLAPGRPPSPIVPRPWQPLLPKPKRGRGW